ncbi:MAG: cyclophilin-like fold protein [Methanomassiliicoccales archaeon]
MITPNDEYLIELNDTKTAMEIWDALPFETYTNVWGAEISFEIPIAAELERGKTLMEVGEVAFWPDGNALCLFYGPTPVSRSNKPEAISKVTPVGRILGDPGRLKNVGDRMRVILERA